MSSVETGQMSAVETGQMSAAETGQMSAVETRQMLKSQIRGWAQNHKNGSEWFENSCQAFRVGPNESHGRSGALGTGPAGKNPAQYNPNSKSTAPPTQRPLVSMFLPE